MGEKKRPKVAMIMGDAAGVGPEIVAKSMNTEETRRICLPAVIGEARVMSEAVKLTRVPLKIVIRRNWAEVTGEAGLMEMFDLANLDPGEYKMGEVNARAGKACLEYLDFAITQARDGQVEAIVFAPLNKLAMSLGNPGFKGEQSYFAGQTRSELYGEINVMEPLFTSRVTSHIGFKDIVSRLSPERISRAIKLLHRTMCRAGIERPPIGVAALNPHGGEQGLFGPEEDTIIRPAIEKARAEGINVLGPFPADTIFVRARRGEFSGVVTLYHDQGQIALKLLGFDRGVTVAEGHPFVLTTPAHGTAFDIAGQGIADIGAFQAALRIAVRMALGPK
jgi:4-phospho-D-threonate 3-dehydrogenase / 4-phospho-D-erythronate 3-dehydrogenase